MNNKTIYRAVLAFTLLASLIFGVFMTLSIAQSTNTTITDINAYSADKVKFFKLISWLYMTCVAGFLCFTFVYKSKFSKSIKFSSGAYKCTCIIGACASLGIVLYSILAETVFPTELYTPKSTNSIDSFYRIIKHTTEGTTVNLPFLALIIVTALSAFYFAYCVFSKDTKTSGIFAMLSLAPVTALSIKLIFDFLMQNSNGYGQLYNYHLLTVGFFLLFFMNESRFYMRKATPALYIFFGLAGALSATVFDIPVLSLSISGIVKISAANILFCMVDLAVVAYIYIRLFNLDIKIPKATKHGVNLEETVENTETME